jgi:hypothetical protein
MALKFSALGYQWTLREGCPPIVSQERTNPTFVEALKAAHRPLSKMSLHEIASWIVARLDYLTAGSLALEGNEFQHDTNEFGYMLKLSDEAATALAHGAVMIHAERVYFQANDVKVPDFQTILVNLLTETPRDLSKCEIIVYLPESKRKRRYGWDGYAFFNR